jgi:hypothetical protein
MRRSLALVRTDVSEEHVASNKRVKRISEPGKKLAVATTAVIILKYYIT